MKVMCIKKDVPARPHPDLIKACNEIQVGNIYTVVDEGNYGYELEEFPHPHQIYWDRSCFAPISNIDERELVNEKLETA